MYRCMLPNKRHGVVLAVGLALLALGFVGSAAADPGASVSADSDDVEVHVDSGNGSLTCTFATDAEQNDEACRAEGFEAPDDGDDGDGTEFDPSVDAAVGPGSVEAAASTGEGGLECAIAPPEEGDEPEAPCEGTVPGQDELPEDGDDNEGDDGGSSNVEFEGSVGEDGVWLSVGDGEDGLACALDSDYEGEGPPCERLGDDGDSEQPEPPEDVPTEELPTDDVLTEDLLLDYLF